MHDSIERILKEVRIDRVRRRRTPIVAPHTTLSEVYTVLTNQRRGAVLVCEDDEIVGIFTERDVLYRTAMEKIDLSTPISELMTPEPTTVSGKEHLAEAIQSMTKGGLRHVPLTDAEGRYAGLLTSRDVLEFVSGYFPEAVLNLPPRLHQRLLRPEGG